MMLVKANHEKNHFISFKNIKKWFFSWNSVHCTHISFDLVTRFHLLHLNKWLGSVVHFPLLFYRIRIELHLLVLWGLRFLYHLTLLSHFFFYHGFFPTFFHFLNVHTLIIQIITTMRKFTSIFHHFFFNFVWFENKGEREEETREKSVQNKFDWCND